MQTLSPNANEAMQAAGVMDLQPEHLRQTRHQITALVADIAAASRSPIDQQGFFQLAMDRMREAMNADSIALWTCDDSTWTTRAALPLHESLIEVGKSTSPTRSDLSTSVEQQFQSIEWSLNESQSNEPANEDTDASATINSEENCYKASQVHATLLNVIAAENQPTLVPPASPNPPFGRPSNPSPSCLVFAPIRFEAHKQCLWLEVVLTPSGGPAAHRGYLRFAVQVADLIADFLRNDRLRTLTREKLLFDAAQNIVEGLSTTSLSNIDTSDSAKVILREVARFADADEAILLVRNVNHRYISLGPAANSLHFNSNSDAAISIRDWSEHQTKQTHNNRLQPGTYKSTDEADRTTHELLGACEIGWLPIAIDQGKSLRHAFVAIVVLWYSDTDSTNGSRLTSLQQMQSVAKLGVRLSARSLACETLHAIETPSLRPSMIRAMLRQPATRIAMLTTALIAACCVPVPLTLTAPATLTPDQSRTVYASSSGSIEEVMVRYGQRVSIDQPLLRIKSPELENEYEGLLAEQIETEQRVREIGLQLVRSNDLNAQQRGSLEGEEQTLTVRAKSIRQRLDLLRSQMSKLEVRSTIEGIVGTWKIDTALNHKPVQHGQSLATVYNPEAGWSFEIALAEKDVGDFLRNVNSGSASTIRCRLDSTPLDRIDLKLEMPEHLVMHVDPQGNRVVPIKATVDPSKITQLTPGATAVVEVPIGNRPVVWVLTREFVLNTWAKLRLWI
jgi:hypothetical protein